MSNYSSTSIYALSGSFVGLSLIAVGLRFRARHKTNVALGIEDWLTIPCLISYLAIAACSIEFAKIADFGDTSLSESEQTAKIVTPLDTKLQLIIGFLSTFCLACSKASICFFYRRIFVVYSRLNRGLNITLITTIVVIACWFIALTVVYGLDCSAGHLSALWETQYYGKYCTHEFARNYAVAVSDVILDVWVLIIPIPLVFRLRTSILRRLLILGMFLLGATALGASIARLAIYTPVYEYGFDYVSTHNAAYLDARTYFYINFESGISIIAICLPVIGPHLINRDLIQLANYARGIMSLLSLESRRHRSLRSEESTSAPVNTTLASSRAPRETGIHPAEPRHPEKVHQIA